MVTSADCRIETRRPIRFGVASAFLRGHRKERSSLLMDALAVAPRTLDRALFVFRKRQDGFKRLLAIFAVKLIAGHGDLRRTPQGIEVFPIMYARRPLVSR